ncbi:type IV secretion system protein VirB9 [endosymbiont of Acanthamoeba sp. UWC8]|uniref:TrbG/VirB9 family P-type conjugative transfer protein n=1 Tax=endosymbiont of Acanthamoeba sp. UWC8 TaxID=86106 RepID=UPI0004D1B5C1|nr:TrbG/VirB9 family P-type conjugative transfer protein [endosymbiont of Acanthamoeba sp. UWC8]AIF81508.1 type IV secretion system protein VirB9 [endosymbiont of Acanthamoeba sp. UWC8]
MCSLTKRFVLLILLILLILPCAFAHANQPIAIDSRIKTFVYSENEVFRVVVHYGYQTSIEFADGEEIQTISVGNSFAWQLIPVGRRLFIRPLEENILTNMTIITNMRTYQFEIQSRLLSYTIDEELVYVVRFFYPDDETDQIKPQVKSFSEQDAIPVVKPFNFNYTLSGADRIAPIKIFDDGINTFFEFPSTRNVPQISTVNGKTSVKLVPKIKGKYIVVNTVAPEFELSDNTDIVKVYNENYKK